MASCHGWIDDTRTGFEHAPAERAQSDGRVWGPPHGGTDLGDGLPAGFGQCRHGVDGFQLALARAHRGGRVALQEFHGVVSLGRRAHHLLGAHILGVVDHPVRGRPEERWVGIPGQGRAPILRPLGFVTVHPQGPSRSRLEAVVHRTRPGAGQPAGGRRVLDEFIQAAVAGQPSGCENVADRDRGKEPGGCFVVDGSVAGHVQEGGGSRPPDRRDQQVAAQAPTVAQLHTPHGLRSPHRSDDVLILAGIHQRHVRTGPLQVGCRGVPVGVGCEHHRGAARPNRVHVDETAYCPREHDTRLVVAVEDVGTLDQARRGDQHLGPGLDQTLHRDRVVALDDGGPVVLVATGDGRVDQDLDPRGFNSGGELGGQGTVGFIAPEEVATQTVAMLDEKHLRPGLCGCERGRHPGRTPACHHHVGMGVTLVVVAVGSIEVDPAPRRERGQHLLVGGPEPLRPHEGLVVEPGGQEP